MAEAAKKPAAKKAEPKKAAEPTTPYARVSKFGSHGSQYTILRISRETGDTLKAGTVYDLKVGADGAITLKPRG